MILINLLPEEYRENKRTPVKFLSALAGAVALVGCLGAWWAWLAFGVKADVDARMAVHQDIQESLAPQVKYYRDLENENKQYESREGTLVSITQSRVSWTRKVDELIDLINVGGDKETYLVWLDDLSVSQVAGRGDSHGSLTANGYSGSENFAHVANFLEDLEASTFCDTFHPPSAPEGSQSSIDEDLIPSEVWKFPLELDLLPPEMRP